MAGQLKQFQNRLGVLTMCSGNLRELTTRTIQLLTGLKWQVIVGSALLLTGMSVSAQTVVEEVELPKPVILKSGVPIPDIESAAKRAINIDSADESSRRSYTHVKEYKLGKKTVREYRLGPHLQYVEVTNEAGTTYIVENYSAFKSDENKPRSGVIVSTW